MHFAVDAHAIGRRLTGNEVYVRNLLDQYAALDRDSRFTAYYSEPSACDHIPSCFEKRRVAINPFVRLGLDLARHLRRDAPDLIHVQYNAPLGCPVPVVVTVHDVSYLEHPEYFTRSRAWQLRQTVARTVRRAALVLTPSEFSRQRIERAYGLDSSRIRVVPNAVSSVFRPIQRDQALGRVRRRNGIYSPFVLCVGDLQPRKNQVGLIDAFREMVQSTSQISHDLVFCGKSTWHGEQVREAARASGLSGRIHFTGFVSDEELIDLYNAADLFVFPSFYEGFGLPILEAMACGRAVACSNTSAMTEVANATALLFDPYNRSQMVRAMRDLLLDLELRTRMERLSLQRAASFTWQAAAQKTLEVYYEVAEQSRRVAATAVLPVAPR